MTGKTEEQESKSGFWMQGRQIVLVAVEDVGQLL